MVNIDYRRGKKTTTPPVKHPIIWERVLAWGGMFVFSVLLWLGVIFGVIIPMMNTWGGK